MKGTCLTFDKSTQEFDHFIHSIKLVGETGRLSREEFVNRFAKSMNKPATREDGSENRAWYNKSNFCRYYGFLDLEEEGKQSFITITPRGKLFLNLLEPLPNSGGLSKYWIPTRNRIKLLQLFLDAFEFDSFGYNNTGAADSDSHISPPTAMFRLIHEIPNVTNQEITFSLFKMHEKHFQSIEEAIEQLKQNRDIPGFSYNDSIEELKIVTQTKDFKLGKLFADSGINFLKSTKLKTKNTEFSFTSDVPQNIQESFGRYDGFSKPLRLLINVRSYMIFKQWARNCVAGRTADDSKVFWVDFDEISFNDFKISVFLDALVSAYIKPKDTTYLFMFAKTKNVLRTQMGYLENLLDFSYNVNSPYFGCSSNGVHDEKIVGMIIDKCRSVSKSKLENVLPWNKMVQTKQVQLPINLHVIGGYQYE